MAQNIQSSSLLAVSLLVGLITLFGSAFVKLYRARMLLIERRRKGLPVAPGHSFLFGHLLYLKGYLDRIPKDAHYQYAFGQIGVENFPESGAYYIDLWPMTGITLVIFSPKIGAEVTQTNHQLNCNRPKLLSRFFLPITGGPSMFDVNEAAWRPWRTVFNKGFHSDHISSLVPGITDEILVYIDTLRAAARKDEMIYLEPITLRFMIDVIGKTILNSSLGSQKGYNALADGMLSQIQWWHNANNELNPLSNLNFVRAFMQWKNGRQMNQYIGSELDKRYENYKADVRKNSKSLSVIDLVLRAYLSGPYKSTSPPARLDDEFRDLAIRQIRLFVFAGHDSTASTICYIFHALSKHPEALARLRQEHNNVLGPDSTPEVVASKIAENPRIANNLPYTLAVIKEAMRLYPPAGASRDGVAGVDLKNDAGKLCPTDHTILWILHPEVHQWEKYWVRGNEFLPERWLVPADHSLHPIPGTWRPFEVGPRNCIAQAMVMLELRLLLACMIRSFDIKPAFEEYDTKRGVKSNSLLVHGERAYQIERGASHPVGGYPCRISLARDSSSAI